MYQSFRTLLSGLRRPSQKTGLAVCAIFRNEANYLEEWLDFHTKNGVDEFFLINHKSEDHFRSVLRPWISRGLVHLIDATTDDQVLEYNNVLKKFGEQVKWLAFIDLDEFLFSPTNASLPMVLKKFKRVAGVFVYWRLFGSSSIPTPVGADGAIRSFRLCLPPAPDFESLEAQRLVHRTIKEKAKMTGSPIQGKCIIRPSRVREMGVHWPNEFRGYLSDESGRFSKTHFPQLISKFLPSMEILRINHYWSRSIEELTFKSLREPVHRGLRNDRTHNELPGERSLEWDQHLNFALDNAVLENIELDLPFVFLIGFNRTATKSFHHFFERNGFRSLHWDNNGLVEKMLENVGENRRVLSGYEEFRAFSDLTLISDHSFFEGNSMFRELFQSYPSAYFILNNRNTQDWLDSRVRHNSGLFAERHLKLRGLRSVEELRRVWELEKINHENQVRAFFGGHRRFAEIDIDSKKVVLKLNRLFGREFDYASWPVVESIGAGRR